MSEIKRGSGITDKSIVAKLREVSKKQFADELGQFLDRGKKWQVEDVQAGFESGMSAILRHLSGMGVIVIAETAEQVAEAMGEKAS